MLKPNIGRDVGRSETSAYIGGSVKDTNFRREQLVLIETAGMENGKHQSSWVNCGNMHTLECYLSDTMNKTDVLM